MNTSTSESVVPESNHREGVVDFVRWLLAQLELEVEETGGVGRLQLDPSDRDAFGGQTELRIALQDAPADGQLEPLDFENVLSKWLLARLRTQGPAAHVRPCDQPTAVKDISSRLFTAYRVEGGRVHLGGCQLVDFPFLRLSFAAMDHGRPCVRHLFVAHDGTSVSDGQAHDLGLLDVEPILKSPPRIDETVLSALIASGRRIATKNSTSRDPSASTVDPISIALVWVKHASGQLHFTVGDTTVALPFSGWARLIEAQPFVAKRSGASSFHLAATDDGDIDAFEEIATCEQSGRRVLQQDLVTCSVTGKRLLEKFTKACPVSGKPTQTDQFSNCSICQQRVSDSVLENETCAACRQMAKIKKDDPRLVWILGEHTGLDRWKRWQLAETQNVYIAQAESLMKRLLVVADKETLAVRHLATSGRLASGWTPTEEAARAELLQ
ncbi:MAG: hypothetical protein GXP28_02095 [Planctomycetes bacterium]|nr:hypothetical protein [Planctomycetota bacterium]